MKNPESHTCWKQISKQSPPAVMKGKFVRGEHKRGQFQMLLGEGWDKEPPNESARALRVRSGECGYASSAYCVHSGPDPVP